MRSAPGAGANLVDRRLTRRSGVEEGGYNGPDTFLGSLVRADFSDAALYRWALEQPMVMDEAEPADATIAAAPPADDSLVARSFAVLSSDLADPNAVMMRMRVYPPGYTCESGTFQTYLGGAFNLAGYGERLAIEKAGYHRIEDYHYGTSAIRKSAVLIDGQNDPSFLQVRGRFVRALLGDVLDYAELRTDRGASPDACSHVASSVDSTRRVLFVDRRYFLLCDTLSSSAGSHSYDWLLHGATGGGSFEQDTGARTARWTKPSGAKLFMQLLTPGTLSTEPLVENDFIDQDDEQGRAEPYAKATAEGTQAQFLAVLYPLDGAMTEPTVTSLSVTGAVAARITGGASDGTVVVALRTSAGSLSHEGEYLCDTDALLCMYKLDDQGQPAYLAMVDGTSAQLFGTSYALSLSAPGTALLRAAPGGPEFVEAVEIPPEGG